MQPSAPNGNAAHRRASGAKPGLVEARPWQGSEDEAKALKKRKRAFIIAGGLVLLGALFVLGGVTYGSMGGDPFYLYGAGAFVGVYGGLFTAWIGHLSFAGERTKFTEREETIAAAANRRRMSNLIVDELSLENVFLNNRQAVDSYHALTKSQAQKAFTSCQLAMAIGLAVLIFGAGVVLSGASTPVKITVGVLTGISTLLSGYVTRTFLKAYSSSIDQMNKFYQQPVIAGYLIHAERIAQHLGDAKTRALESLVAECIAAAQRVAPGTTLPPSSRQPRRHRGKAESPNGNRYPDGDPARGDLPVPTQTTT
jgi:hypothetical protein